jgi:hypothetical protein
VCPLSTRAGSGWGNLRLHRLPVRLARRAPNTPKHLPPAACVTPAHTLGRICSSKSGQVKSSQIKSNQIKLAPPSAAAARTAPRPRPAPRAAQRRRARRAAPRTPRGRPADKDRARSVERGGGGSAEPPSPPPYCCPYPYPYCTLPLLTTAKPARSWRGGGWIRPADAGDVSN